MRFQDLIGQEAAVGRVQEAIRHNRLAHALLLTGPGGVGKLALATAIAQYVNCVAPVDGDSCGRCPQCLKISRGVHPDLRYVLPIISKTSGGRRFLTADYFDEFRQAFFADPYFGFAAWQRMLGGDNKQLFISVHEIRDLKRGVYLKSFEGAYKCIIVWNAEYINTEGANAFLKLLEEPPDRTLILMTCSDPSLLLTTINSRCQRIPLARIPAEAIQAHLETRRGLAPAEARELAGIAEGSIANAQEFLTDSSQSLSRQYADWLRAVYMGDFQKIEEATEPIYQESKEFQKLFLQVAVRKMRDSLLFHLGQPDLALTTEAERSFHERFGAVVDPDKVDRMATEIEDSYRYLSGNAHPQMVFTALSLRMHAIMRGS